MSRIGKLDEISRIDQALAENEARITRQREIISSLNPLSRAAKRAKTLLYVFLFAQAECAVTAVPSPALAVPASLHASLMARLDRLGAAKEIAQIGAAIGREF